jgi:hypothetical protein
MSVGPKLGVLGIINVRCVLTSGTRVNVSRFGTHRSNEWDGKIGLIRCSPRCAGLHWA